MHLLEGRAGSSLFFLSYIRLSKLLTG